VLSAPWAWASTRPLSGAAAQPAKVGNDEKDGEYQ